MLIIAIIGIIVILIVANVILLFFTYNNLTKLKTNVKNSWNLIDLELKKRFELVPNLIEILRTHMKYEKETLNAITEANNKYNISVSIEEKSVANSTLTYNLKSVFALAQAYPELKSNENFKNLQKELSLTEENINHKKQLYNDAVKIYNDAINAFPNKVLANKFRFYPECYFKF